MSNDPNEVADTEGHIGKFKIEEAGAEVEGHRTRNKLEAGGEDDAEGHGAPRRK